SRPAALQGDTGTVTYAHRFAAWLGGYTAHATFTCHHVDRVLPVHATARRTDHRLVWLVDDEYHFPALQPRRADETLTQSRALYNEIDIPAPTGDIIYWARLNPPEAVAGTDSSLPQA